MPPEDNPADDVPADRESYDAYSKPKKGQVWIVRAWWTKGSVECRIHSFMGNSVLVLPLKGNPHSRYVNTSDLESRIGGHPMELDESAVQ